MKRRHFFLLGKDAATQQQGQHLAADPQDKTHISVHTGTALAVGFVVAADHIGRVFLTLAYIQPCVLNVEHETAVKKPLVAAMVHKLSTEGRIVSQGKGICGVVDQLPQGIIIRKLQFFFTQPDTNFVHVFAGIVIVVSPEPLGAQGAF